MSLILISGGKGAAVFETGVRQLRMALGLATGARLSPRNLNRLIDDALATLAEFGEPGADAGTVLTGPLSDPAARRDFATRGIRRTALRLAAKSPFYSRRFNAVGLELKRMSLEDLNKIPVTLKRDLVEQANDFRCTGVEPYLATRTTGTTGRPAEIWMSRYEMDLWPALGSLGGVLRGTLLPGDVLQVNVSSRATGSVHLNTASCRLVGAACRVLGIVPPDQALDSLAEGGVTQLATVPSYLAELEVAARRRGMGPADFRLRAIDVGGEVLSPSLERAARETFGAASVVDVFAMTEVIPVTGRTCSQGHLHFDLNMGLVEYLDIETGEPAQSGALASVVVTPFFPYRECTPVFRYDTRDVVRCLPAELTCDLGGLPGCGLIQGKADQLIRLGTVVITPRQLVEAVEALPAKPWPARFSATVHDGRLRLTLPRYAVEGLDHEEISTHFANHGLDPEFSFVDDEEAAALRLLRSDLHEATFAVRPALIGA